jgi:hypothetical protein
MFPKVDRMFRLSHQRALDETAPFGFIKGGTLRSMKQLMY